MADNYIKHYGMPRRSGRYPWGSGENPYQRDNRDFLGQIKELEKAGLTQVEIAKQLGLKSTTELRAKQSIATNAVRKADMMRAMELKEKGYSNTKIGEIMGRNESSIRSLLNPKIAERTTLTEKTAEALKEVVDKKRYVDVGPGTEIELGVTDNRLKNAIALLEEQGYKKQYVQIEQMGTNHKTTITVLTPDDVSYSDLIDHKFDIKTIRDYVIDVDGDRRYVTVPPRSVDSSRIKIVYGDEGGTEKDGTIELRRGVDDISLGQARYAQVRIAVDGTHYLKGMALYSDDIPKGYDIVFNTNKPSGTPKEKVFKPLSDDKNNPFGATIKGDEDLSLIQRYYVDKNGKSQLSCINVVNEEGDWSKWSKSLAAQFLSKQPLPLAKHQLNLAYQERREELDEINRLSNPTVKKKLLESFSDDCDAAAAHLKAAALPRQASKVILPFTDLKDNQIYDPELPDGQRVILVRYPHGGKFEIPELTVNNKRTSAKSVIGDATDAVGINGKVAAKLSGADFDGDTVLVIPVNDKVKIQSRPSLAGLKDFDPGKYYDETLPKMKDKTKQNEMGRISNLITDMTLQGANDDELARAVRHSMVVIDAQKHSYNYKQSYIDNKIDELKKKYQPEGGASTLISRAKSEIDIPERYERTGINRVNTDPETGKKIYRDTEASYLKGTVKNPDTGKNMKVNVYRDKAGKLFYVEPETKAKIYTDNYVKLETKHRTEKVYRMDVHDDAFELTSGGSKEHPGTLMEAAYATYANSMKAMANEARKEYLATPSLKYSPSAKATYAKEVRDLDDKLMRALKNAPRERQAQLAANQEMKAKLQSNPGADAEHIKKWKGQALNRARLIMGAKKEKILITDKEWEAIQAGAITDSKLKRILDNADMDRVKELATPRQAKVTMTTAKVRLAKSMKAAGYTQQEIANRLGVSVSTVSNAIK